MEEQMNYILNLNTFMPSLEHRALVKTVIALWNPDDIQLDDIEWRDDTLDYFQKDEKWIAEDRVIGKVKDLSLPESLKKKISGFIKPIGSEILRWIKYYKNFLFGHRKCVCSKSLIDLNKVGKSLSKLCWTPQGTVDRKKTVEKLIRDENLDITERYKLACFYCFRNDILKLWNKMPQYCKKSFYSEKDPRRVKQNRLVVFWTYDIKGEQTKMNVIFEHAGLTPYEYAFYCAVECNKVATEYFWQILTSEERENYLVTPSDFSCLFHSYAGDNVDISFFLLSQMNEEQQLKQLKEVGIPWALLLCLVYWPRQDFFMEIANRVWAFLSGDDYSQLLIKIINKVKRGYKDYDYKKLFREFWQQSPITLKEYVTDEFKLRLLSFSLVEIEDKEYFKIIFAFISDREKFLFSDKGKHLCESLIFDDKMHLVEFFVRECISSKDVIMKFREEFENYFIHSEFRHSDIKKTRKKKRGKLREFFQLLDELILEDDNRKRVGEGNTVPAAKRLCTHNK